MKINKKIKIILALASILSCININTTYANISESFNFKNITIEDGLSQSTVETIYQDSKGYIWIGTNDGLDRYNGYEFKYYKHDKDDENSIANNYIVSIIINGNNVTYSTVGGNCYHQSSVARGSIIGRTTTTTVGTSTIKISSAGVITNNTGAYFCGTYNYFAI